MLVARARKEENIAEYIIYMWQVEDMLRAMNLDMSLVDKQIVASYDVDDQTRKQIYDWYDNLIEMIKQEKIEKAGHLQVIKNSIDELTEIHFYLLHKKRDPKYHELMTKALQNFIEFRRKSGVDDSVSDVELALNGLYGSLMLRLQGKSLSEQTSTAMESFSRVIAYLAATHKQMEEQNKKEY